jgi:signal transduction histidine kinase
MTAQLADRELPIDDTLKRIVVLFRFLGWAWMLLLVGLTLAEDTEADRAVVIGAMALATIWTGVTVWAAGSSDRLGAAWFVVADLAVGLVVGFATTVAGAEDLFHGGYPMSSLAVVAYATNLRVTIGAAGVIAVEQVLVHAVDDRGRIPAAGSVTFLVFGTVLGWGFDGIRSRERERLATQVELDAARAAEVRQQERLDIANRLHDSVLQTLAALRRDASDAEQVRYLARRQERLLRRTISEYRSPYARSARAEIQTICEDIEDVHRIEIDSVVRGDVQLDDTVTEILAAAREALTNAAKHSGEAEVDLYAELEPGRVEVFVRDRGRGFERDRRARGGGLDHGISGRMARVGGTAEVDTAPGRGTSIELRWAAS